MRSKALQMQAGQLNLPRRTLSCRRWCSWVSVCGLALLVSLSTVWGSLQFDVFVGYDGTVREAACVPDGHGSVQLALPSP